MAFTQTPTVQPTAVRLRGPESRVAGIDTVYLDELDLSDVRESGTWVLGVNRAALSDLIISPDSATVRVEVEESLERMVALAISAEDGSVELSEDTVQVRLFGPRSHVQDLDPSALRAVVRPEDLAGMEPGEERRVLVRLEGLPQGIRAAPESDSVVARRATGP